MSMSPFQISHSPREYAAYVIVFATLLLGVFVEWNVITYALEAYTQEAPIVIQHALSAKVSSVQSNADFEHALMGQIFLYFFVILFALSYFFLGLSALFGSYFIAECGVKLALNPDLPRMTLREKAKVLIDTFLTSKAASGTITSLKWALITLS